MPAASRPARSFAASSSAPGVSPWTQIVSADERSVDGDDGAVLRHPNGARDDGVGVVNDGAGLAARHQRAVGLVGAVGEHFGRDAQAGARPRLSAARNPGRPKRISDGLNAATARAIAAASARVASRHVVERAVRLHVLERTPSTCATPATAAI